MAKRRSRNTTVVFGLLAVAAVAGVALWYFRRRDHYVSVEPVPPPPGEQMLPFLPSTYTPAYQPIDITAPGGADRLLAASLEQSKTPVKLRVV
jgi:hypothetical protein